MTFKSHVAENIKSLAEEFPEVKENYNVLILLYWYIFDDFDLRKGTMEEVINKVKNVTSAETITRWFRRLVEAGEITLPEDVKVARKEVEQVYKNEFAVLY